MKMDTFHAMESAYGDVIDSYIYDITLHDALPICFTSTPDQLGGTWTYTVNTISTANAAHQHTSYAGKLYDIWYHHAHLEGSPIATDFGYGAAVGMFPDT